MKVRSRASRALCLALVLILGVTAASSAASAQIREDEIQIVELDNSAYPQIEVIVDVPESFSDQVLTTRDFVLEEGGVTRQLGVEKLQESTAVVLAIDTSGSMLGDPLAVAKQSALAFLSGLPERNPVAVVGFGSEVLVATSLTNDRDAVRTAISSLTSSGETSLYDALVSSAAILDDATADRFALVVLSDGADTASSASPALAVEQITGTDATLYSVGLETGDSRLEDLEGLTADAGGRYLPASDLTQLGAVYDDLAARLANQYRLTFEATSSGVVEVKVTAVGNDNAVAIATSTTELSADTSVAPAATVGPADDPVTRTSTLEVSLDEVAPGLLEANWALWAGVGALSFTFSVFSYAIFSMTRGSTTRRGMEPRKREGHGNDRKLSGMADWASSLVDRFFLDGTRRGAMNAALDRAGLNVRPGEFIVLTACIAVAGLALGWVIHPLVGLALAAVIAGSARSAVAFMGKRRRSKFATQLDGTLMVLASSLRAGHGVQRALSAVAEESESPTKEEFTRVVAETRIGRDLIDALQGVADRLGNEDFDWVVRAVAINRELGGNLSEVLDNVANTIRERNQLRRQVQALSAEGRLSAAILFVLPFGVGIFVRVTNPGYLNELTESSAGTVMIALAAVAMVGGAIWIKKIVNVRF